MTNPAHCTLFEDRRAIQDDSARMREVVLILEDSDRYVVILLNQQLQARSAHPTLSIDCRGYRHTQLPNTKVCLNGRHPLRQMPPESIPGLQTGADSGDEIFRMGDEDFFPPVQAHPVILHAQDQHAKPWVIREKTIHIDDFAGN